MAAFGTKILFAFIEKRKMANQSTPFYQKVSLNLLSLSILGAALYFGKEIIVPILFSILIASLLLPVTRFLSHKKINRILSILIPLILTIILAGLVVYLLSKQIVNFLDDLPSLSERISNFTDSFQQWFRKSTGMTIRAQNKYIDDTVKDLKENAPNLVGKTFVSITGLLTYLVLLPIYTFLLLYYRSTIKTFLVSVFKNGSTEKVNAILIDATTITQKYLTGLLIETAIVFVLNMTGFLILGIKYAVFLALLAAFLNLIPYIGMIVANVICMLITLVSSDDIGTLLWVGGILGIVQVFDNNFGMPFIVGNNVRINALVTIVGVLIGGALCGISGMFLAIPGLAVLKVIFDKVPPLQPWGILLGDINHASKAPKQ
jgi:predicted PurR-regulated permease PerM